MSFVNIFFYYTIQVCEILQNGGTYVWDDEMKVPYAINGDQWVGFDDEKSIRNKMRFVLLYENIFNFFNHESFFNSCFVINVYKKIFSFYLVKYNHLIILFCMFDWAPYS